MVARIVVFAPVAVLATWFSGFFGSRAVTRVVDHPVIDSPTVAVSKSASTNGVAESVASGRVASARRRPVAAVLCVMVFICVGIFSGAVMNVVVVMDGLDFIFVWFFEYV